LRRQFTIKRRDADLADLAFALARQIDPQARPQHAGDYLLRMLPDARRNHPGGDEQILSVAAPYRG
jgi:hypothetical protein